MAPECSLNCNCSLYLPIQLCFEYSIAFFYLFLQYRCLFLNDPSFNSSFLHFFSSFLLFGDVLNQDVLVLLSLTVPSPVLLYGYTGSFLLLMCSFDCICTVVAS